MTKASLKASIIAAGLVLAASSAAMAQTCCNNQTPSTLNINTSASIKQAPDIATINAGVITQSKSAKTAMADNAVKMSAAFAALKAAGVLEKDMQTSGVNLVPEYVYQENKPPIIKGYQVTNSLNIKIRDMTKVGPVLDSLVAQGINQITGPVFSIDNPEKALDKAREEAILTAVSRANIYAKGAGMKVKRVITINETSDYQQPQPIMMARTMAMKADMAETAVAAGEVNLSVQINVQFELEK